MKVITREVTMYRYVFGKFDLSTGQAKDLTEINRPVPLKRQEVDTISKSTGGAILMHKETSKVKYSLPLEEFVKACNEYASTHNDIDNNE